LRIFIYSEAFITGTNSIGGMFVDNGTSNIVMQ